MSEAPWLDRMRQAFPQYRYEVTGRDECSCRIDVQPKEGT